MPRKKYDVVRLDPKAKKRWESTKPRGTSYSKHLNTLLNNTIKGPKAADITLDLDLDVKCPVLYAVGDLRYCVKNPPRDHHLRSLKICRNI